MDRGSAEKGLRISLIAAYKDPATNQIHELPLTRCIEVWGHIPLDASDSEFKEVMVAIDQINQGLPPPSIPPGRVATGTSSAADSASMGLENMNVGSPLAAATKRT